MPQFDPSSFASQLFWLAVTFSVFVILLSKVVMPRIEGVIEARESKISGDLKRAAEAKAEAEAAMEAYEKALAEARSEAQGVVRSALGKLAEDNAKREAKFNEGLDAKISEAESRISAARDQAMKNVREVAIDVTKAAVERLAGSGADEATVSGAVDASYRSRG